MDKLFGIHERALTLQARRAEVLSTNLANANTPAYKARDVDFASILGAMTANQRNELQLSTTNTRHLNDAAVNADSVELKYRIPFEPSPDGNSVETYREHAEFTENAIRYQMTLTILGGRIRSMMSALRGE
jgi:flagellar basal-body rod protein FlgB